MTADLDLSSQAVEQALIELLEITECRCVPAYTDRGLHSHECHTDDRRNVEILSAKIARLRAERDAAWQAGAKAMREAAILAVNSTAAPIVGTPYSAGGRVFAKAIRALPLPIQPEKS